MAVRYKRDPIIEEMVASGRYRTDLDGAVWRRRKAGTWQRCEIQHTNGYMMVGGSNRQVLAHRLVYRLWFGRIDSTKDVHHKNGTRNDNRPDNLEQLTAKEHMRESYRLGQQPSRKGEGHGRAKLTEAQVIQMRFAREHGASLAELGKYYGILPTSVAGICTGQTWKHIPLKENERGH